MASNTSSSLTFPHPELTTISGEPNTTSLRLLQKELCSNARQIFSPRGGGSNGHLRILLTELEYIRRTNVAFAIPVHPGAAPVHVAQASAFQIAETIRLFNQNVEEHRLYERVQAKLKQQILIAVESRYLQILEDLEFGFADVSPLEMLNHLKDTYGQVSADDIENNRNLLSADWNPDDPIENVWLRIRECQTFARGIEPITDGTAVRLTLTVFETTGVFANAVEKWREKDAIEQTLANFKTHFTFQNKERVRKLTAQTAGYHGANQANIVPASPNDAAIAAAVAAAAATPPAVVVGDIRMYYCHTHGLGKSPLHTSPTCTHPGPEHKTEATISNMMGGNNTIYSRPRQPRFNA
jgi:hypothetical protein